MSDTTPRRDVALITGGTAGIGRAVVLALARNGVDVCCTGRTPGSLDAVSAECRALGVRSLGVVADQRDDAQVQGSVTRCEDELGPITMFVNNAGGVHPGRFLDLGLGDIHDDLRMNLLAPVSYLYEVGGLMTARGHGAIVNVASNRAFQSSASLAGYSAAKAGLVHLTRCLAREWARSNVRVNALCPGATATAMNAEARTDPSVVERVVRMIPAGRYVAPTEVADLITYLLSPASAMVTGASFVIDGGESA